MSDAITATNSDRADPATYLQQHGLLVSQDDDLTLTDPVRDAWATELEQVRSQNRVDSELRARLLRLFKVSANAISIEPVQESARVSVRVDDALVGQWVTLSALIADVTAASVLESSAKGWDSIDTAHQGTILTTLRPFVPLCPVCGADVELQEADCDCGCDGRQDYRFVCVAEDCGEIVYRLDKRTADAFL